MHANSLLATSLQMGWSKNCGSETSPLTDVLVIVHHSSVSFSWNIIGFVIPFILWCWQSVVDSVALLLSNRYHIPELYFFHCTMKSIIVENAETEKLWYWAFLWKYWMNVAAALTNSNKRTVDSSYEGLRFYVHLRLLTLIHVDCLIPYLLSSNHQ